jgi:hypothetical protein
MSAGMILLSRLDVHSSLTTAALDMLVVGFGLGMVMQVLVLAVQNAVEHRHMGVGTSGSLMFRQIGGSIGLAMFGAIFANRLHSTLAERGIQGPKTATPAVVANLPPAVHQAYVGAIASSLRPVFVVAAAISLFAFLLTWLLEEVPLRETTREHAEEVRAA